MLGLNISKAIVERHGGTISFQTEVDVGTTFYFDLPIFGASRVDDLAPAGDDDRPRILICEDEPDIISILDLMLRSGGYATDIPITPKKPKRSLPPTTMRP